MVGTDGTTTYTYQVKEGDIEKEIENGKPHYQYDDEDEEDEEDPGNSEDPGNDNEDPGNSDDTPGNDDSPNDQSTPFQNTNTNLTV